MTPMLSDCNSVIRSVYLNLAAAPLSHRPLRPPLSPSSQAARCDLLCPAKRPTQPIPVHSHAGRAIPPHPVQCQAAPAQPNPEMPARHARRVAIDTRRQQQHTGLCDRALAERGHIRAAQQPRERHTAGGGRLPGEQAREACHERSKRVAGHDSGRRAQGGERQHLARRGAADGCLDRPVSGQEHGVWMRAGVGCHWVTHKRGGCIDVPMDTSVSETTTAVASCSCVPCVSPWSFRRHSPPLNALGLAPYGASVRVCEELCQHLDPHSSTLPVSMRHHSASRTAHSHSHNP
eukprot:364253-Chlamydomonas_euryale.AAC.12